MPVEIATRAGAAHGAAPTWDASTRTLLWVDTPAGLVHRYDPTTGTDSVLEVSQQVGAAKPRTAGGLVCNLTEGVALLDADGGRRWLVYWARDGVRCAAAAVDPRGRLWAGCSGWLTVVEPDGTARVVVSDVVLPAAVAFSQDETLLYLVDGPNGRLDVFDVDVDAATLAKRRPLARFVGAGGLPASACVDADGCLWVALDGAGAVRRHTPGGGVDATVTVPAARVTGAAFGGHRLTDLYLTTAAGPTEHDGALLVLPDAGEGLPTPAFCG